MVSTDPIGVLIVGVHGRTAQTVVAGALAASHGDVEAEYGITGRPSFQALDLVEPGDLRWGGWDVVDRPTAPEVQRLATLCGRPPSELRVADSWQGVSSGLDFDRQAASRANDLDQAIELLREDIREFKRSHRVSDLIVFNLSNPPSAGTSANPRSAYGYAAVREGCDFVEFTPTSSIDSELVSEAEANECQIAGRDGSTGQTFLKLVLADALLQRGLTIRSWYSTNILGNHDGEVLADPSFSADKLHDKRLPLEGRIAGGPENHVVRIDYVPDRDDVKEAWDSVRLQGWMGSRHRLQLVWEGEDSFLAAPLILDVIRLLSFSRQRRDRSGLRPELAPFFKNPMEACSPRWWDQVARLYSFYGVSSQELPG